jgi:hypothetical protein
MNTHLLHLSGWNLAIGHLLFVALLWMSNVYQPSVAQIPSTDCPGTATVYLPFEGGYSSTYGSYCGAKPELAQMLDGTPVSYSVNPTTGA